MDLKHEAHVWSYQDWSYFCTTNAPHSPLDIHHGSVTGARIILSTSSKGLPFTAVSHFAGCSQELFDIVWSRA